MSYLIRTLLSLSFFIETTYSYQPFVSKDAYNNIKEYEGFISFFECSHGLILINFDLKATQFNRTQVFLYSFGYIVDKKNYDSTKLSYCRYIYE